MKRIIMMSFSLLLLMTSCYDEYKTDYDYTASYFSYQYPVRTLYIDRDSETMSFKVGAAMGGRYSYEGNTEKIYFSIEDTLINNNEEYLDAGIKVMPEDWYSLSNDSEFVLDGASAGQITVTINRDLFIANEDASENTYAIPFVLTGTSCDSLLAGKDYSVVVVKYKNEFDGRYYVKGSDNTLDAAGNILSTETYANDALVLNKYVFLNTVEQDMVEISRVGINEDKRTYLQEMQINPSDGSAMVSRSREAEDSDEITSIVGAATYDQMKRKFISKYNYFKGGIEHSVVDTLIFYNRHDVREEWK